MSGAPLPESCDVAVIGAGMGGLTAAATLAKAGLRVVVLEMDLRPGGYLAGFQRKKFLFDTAIHWLNQCGEGGLTRKIFDFLGPGAPATPPLQRIRRYRGDHHDYLLTDKPEDLRDAFVADFPSDAAGIQEFFAAAQKVGRRFAKICEAGRTPLTMSFLEKHRTMLPIALQGLGMLGQGGASEKKLPKYFQSQGLREVFGSEESFLSCLVPIGWAYEGDYQLPPAGGSVEFPKWLCGLLEENGGQLSFRSRVEEILLDKKRVTGLRFSRTARGETTSHTLRCDSIVAAGDLATVYRDMLPADAIPQRVRKRLDSADLYDSSVSVYLGIDAPPETLGFGEEMISITRDGVPRKEQSGPDPDRVALSVLAPSLRDPTLAPAGSGTLVIYAPARLVDHDHWQTEPGLVRGEAYRACKQAYADVLIDRVAAAVSPDLRKHIQVCEVATPITHQRYTGNRDGTIMAARPSGRNIFGRVASYKTPVRNLWVGSHWAEYGGGVPVAVRAGFNCALLILQQADPVAFEVYKRVLDA